MAHYRYIAVAIEVALLYTTLSIADALASLNVSLLLAGLLTAGLELGGVGIGLPFLVAGGLYSLSGVGIWFVRATREGDDSEG